MEFNNPVLQLTTFYKIMKVILYVSFMIASCCTCCHIVWRISLVLIADAHFTSIGYPVCLLQLHSSVARLQQRVVALPFYQDSYTVGNPYAAYQTEQLVLVCFWMHVQKQQAVFSNMLLFILLNSVSVIFIIMLSVSIVTMELPYQFNVRTSV